MEKFGKSVTNRHHHPSGAVVMTPVERFVGAIVTALRAGLSPDEIRAAILSAAEVKP